MLTTFDVLSSSQHQDIFKLTLMPEWKSYEKFLENCTLRFYKDILIDEDVAGAKKLIHFTRAIKNLPKGYGNKTQSLQTEHQEGTTDDIVKELEKGNILL